MVNSGVTLLIKKDGCIAIRALYFNSAEQMEDWLQKQSFKVLYSKEVDKQVYYMVISNNYYGE